MPRQLEVARELPSCDGQILYCCLMVRCSTPHSEGANISQAQLFPLYPSYSRGRMQSNNVSSWNGETFPFPSFAVTVVNWEQSDAANQSLSSWTITWMSHQWWNTTLLP